MAICMQRVGPHMRLFSRPRLLMVLIVSLLAMACSGSDDAAAVIPTTPPAIEAGTVATGSVEIDGATIDYVTSVPDGFSIGDEAPLLLAFPPGGQDLDLTLSLVEGTYAPESRRLGWVVISPAAPAGELFFQGSESLVPGFLDWVETWVRPEGDSPHVAGVSNGGISTFRYAALNPSRLQSLIAFPGFPRSDEDQAALAQLVDVPIRLFVGGNDSGWIPPAQDAVARSTDLGGDAELTIFEGEGHVMDSTRDGTIIFELLESFR
jgi:pimeloyl-ACP methyl ester carboxylesterase